MYISHSNLEFLEQLPWRLVEESDRVSLAKVDENASGVGWKCHRSDGVLSDEVSGQVPVAKVIATDLWVIVEEEKSSIRSW